MSSAARTVLPPGRAIYADLEAVPATKVAELIRGTLYVMPRPASRHARASSMLGGKLTNPFDLGDGGPGGWVILDEPELHFPDPTLPPDPESFDALVPDLAGWKRERMPAIPDVAAFTLPPDWICEVLSKSTETIDREEKMPIYAREGVRHAWLMDPVQRTLEVYVLGAGRRWGEPTTYSGAEVVRAVPFDAIALDLSALWM
jgi:Uma2 family endonuclease